MKKLNQYEKDIQNYGIELGAEDKIREAMNNKETAKTKDTNSNSKPEPKLAPELDSKQAPASEREQGQEQKSEPVAEPKPISGPVPEPGSTPKGKPVKESNIDPELEPEEDEMSEQESENLPVVKKFADRHPRLAKIPFLARFMDWVSEKVEKVKVFFRGLRGGKEENKNIEEKLGNIDKDLKQREVKTEEKDRDVQEKTNGQKDSEEIDFEDIDTKRIDEALETVTRLEETYGEGGTNPVDKVVGKGDEAVKDFVSRIQEGVSDEAKAGINSLNKEQTSEPTPSNEHESEEEIEH